MQTPKLSDDKVDWPGSLNLMGRQAGDIRVPSCFIDPRLGAEETSRPETTMNADKNKNKS